MVPNRSDRPSASAVAAARSPVMALRSCVELPSCRLFSNEVIAAASCPLSLVRSENCGELSELLLHIVERDGDGGPLDGDAIAVFQPVSSGVDRLELDEAPADEARGDDRGTRIGGDRLIGVDLHRDQDGVAVVLDSCDLADPDAEHPDVVAGIQTLGAGEVRRDRGAAAVVVPHDGRNGQRCDQEGRPQGAASWELAPQGVHCITPDRIGISEDGAVRFWT